MGNLIKRLYIVRQDQDEFLANKAFGDYNRKGNKKSTVLRQLIDQSIQLEKEAKAKGERVCYENNEGRGV